MLNSSVLLKYAEVFNVYTSESLCINLLSQAYILCRSDPISRVFLSEYQIEKFSDTLLSE